MAKRIHLKWNGMHLISIISILDHNNNVFKNKFPKKLYFLNQRVDMKKKTN